MITIPAPKNYNEWRDLARGLLVENISPQELLWQPSDEVGLFNDAFIFSAKPANLRIQKGFLELAKTAACYRSGEQWPILYSMLWRLTHGEPHLLNLSTDPEVHRIKAMVKSISRDIHKMHAFVRFRKTRDCEITGREQFVSWFEPEHHIVRLTSGFFRKRFSAMDWSILTPDDCMHWYGKTIHFTEGVDKSQAPDEDAQDELWRTYYRSIFNPARLKVKAMQSEMPKKYWKNLPEAEIIKELIASSNQQTQAMLERPTSPEKPAPKNSYLEKISKLGDAS